MPYTLIEWLHTEVLLAENANEEAVLLLILQVARRNEPNILEIMFQTFITYAKAQSYLDYLVKNGLLEQDASKKTYKLTDRGESYLAAFARRQR